MEGLADALLTSAWITAKIAAGLGLATWAIGVATALPRAGGRPPGKVPRARFDAALQAGVLIVGGALAALTAGEAQRRLPAAVQGLLAATAALAGPLGGALGAWSARALYRGEGLRTDGPYAVVRHPLYASLLLCAGAVALSLGSVSGTAALVAALGFVSSRRARREDATLARAYGEAHAAYAARVRGFIPKL